jgi:demethylmenaquinone methyltransferase/2-methoxy-6-polyprenyl-1,4-benzoquinol methylase
VIAPPAGDPGQKQRVRAMFDGVAPRYDLLNRLLSVGTDGGWRRGAIRALELRPGDRLLDLCAGTGDLGLEARRRVPGVHVLAVDLSREMLARGELKRRRVKGAVDTAAHVFVQGDAERLPVPDASMDRACVGFGIRNVASLERALAETARVLRPGGLFVILEFSTPPRRALRALYHAYFHRVLPAVGGWVSGRPEAYAYLPASVARFPEPEALAALARGAGFKEVRWRYLSGGIAALHLCRR